MTSIPRSCVALAAVLCACGTDSLVDVTAARTVVLQYATPVTAADSISASLVANGPVTVSHFLNAIIVVTSASVTAFSYMNPKPAAITDTDSLQCDLVDISVATISTPTAADSAFLVSRGVHVLYFDNQLFVELTATTLDRAATLAGDPNILGGHVEFDCFKAGFRRAAVLPHRAT
jgi:hypothetical protein